MTRSIHKLNDRKVRGLTKSGRVADGGGLYIRVRNADAKSWVFIYRQGDKWNELGLGAFPEVTLLRARGKAAEMRSLLENGGDPKAARAPKVEPTFKDVAAMLIAAMKDEWSNAKHRYQWEQTLGPTYCGTILNKKVLSIGLDDVLAVLSPVWQKKPETASRLRGRIEKVLNFAKTKGWRSGENPAAWRGNLENVLPKRDKKKTVIHLAALDYGEVPIFMERLRASESLCARALEFQILTASRSGEVLDSQWSEVNLESALWVIPKHRMKARVEHRVPLSGGAVAILKQMLEVRTSDFVFPGNVSNKALSNMALAMLMRRMKVDAVPHGFRSSFRDWAGDQTSFPREIAEAALAHQVGNEVERSYRRGDALEKRRLLMDAWANYCIGIRSNVLKFATG